MTYTLGTAATATGLNKSTVLRAIQNGKISAAKDEHGQWCIDPAELHRVYRPVAATAADNGAEQRHASADDNAQLRAQAFLAEQRLSDLKVMLDEMRRDRDAWRDQAQRLAITDRSEPRPWWRRFARAH